MQIINTKNYQEMSEATVQLFLQIIMQNQNKQRINIALTGGKSPKIFYKRMIEEIQKISFLNKIHFYNFDEIPLKSDLATGITIQELNSLFFDHINISQKNIHKLNVLNYSAHCKQLINDAGLDLVLLGIGIDGHFCGNMSGVTKFGDQTRLIRHADLVDNISINQLNIDFSKFNTEYVTMGPREIMGAKNIIMMASGVEKAEVINQIIHGPIIEQVPASLLTLHPFFTLILDEQADSIAQVSTIKA